MSVGTMALPLAGMTVSAELCQTARQTEHVGMVKHVSNFVQSVRLGLACAVPEEIVAGCARRGPDGQGGLVGQTLDVQRHGGGVLLHALGGRCFFHLNRPILVGLRTSGVSRRTSKFMTDDEGLVRTRPKRIAECCPVAAAASGVCSGGAKDKEERQRRGRRKGRRRVVFFEFLFFCVSRQNFGAKISRQNSQREIAPGTTADGQGRRRRGAVAASQRPPTSWKRR